MLILGEQDAVLEVRPQHPQREDGGGAERNDLRVAQSTRSSWRAGPSGLGVRTGETKDLYLIVDA